MSSGLITAPDGFDGEFRMITLVRGVIKTRHHLGGHAETLRLVGLKQHAIAAGITHDVFERNPVGNRQDDFVAVIDQHLDRVEQRMLAAGRGDDLFAAVVRTEIDVCRWTMASRNSAVPATAVYLVKLS